MRAMIEPTASRVVPPLEPAKRLKCYRAGVRAQHTVTLRIAAPQVALDSAQYFRVVINRQQYGFCHLFSLMRGYKGIVRETIYYSPDLDKFLDEPQIR